MEEKDSNIELLQSVEELSADEFQQKLFTWFKSRGLVSELKTHLRYQMINVLKETRLGQTISNTTAQPISPKLQVVILLIAEFLLRHNYTYSLSILSSEVPYLNNINEFKDSVNIYNQKKKISKLNFVEVVDILDTLNLTQNTIEGENILISYHNSEDALLTCILRYLSKQVTLKPAAKEETEISIHDIDESSNLPEWQISIHNVLSKIKLKASVFLLLRDSLNKLFEAEIEKYQQEEKLKNDKFIQEKETAVKSQLEKQKATLKKHAKQSEEKLLKYKNSIDKEFKAKQKHLEKLATQLQLQYERVSKEIENNEARSKDLDAKENRLKEMYEQRSHEMENLRKDIEMQSTLLHEKESYIRKLEQDIENNKTTVKSTILDQISEVSALKNRCSHLQQELSETKTIVSEHIESKQAAQSIEENISRESLEQLRSENFQLKTQLEELRSLRSTTSQQQAFQFIASSDRNIPTQVQPVPFVFSNVRMISTPPLQIPPVVPRRRGQRLTRQLGGGEEVTSPANQTDRTNVRNQREARRRTYRRPIYGSSTSDSSPTDEVLRDARERLRNLERETEAIERRYTRYRERESIDFFDLCKYAIETIEKNRVLASESVIGIDSDVFNTLKNSTVVNVEESVQQQILEKFSTLKFDISEINIKNNNSGMQKKVSFVDINDDKNSTEDKKFSNFFKEYKNYDIRQNNNSFKTNTLLQSRHDDSRDILKIKDTDMKHSTNESLTNQENLQKSTGAIKKIRNSKFREDEAYSSSSERTARNLEPKRVIQPNNSELYYDCAYDYKKDIEEIKNCLKEMDIIEEKFNKSVEQYDDFVDIEPGTSGANLQELKDYPKLNFKNLTDSLNTENEIVFEEETNIESEKTQVNLLMKNNGFKTLEDTQTSIEKQSDVSEIEEQSQTTSIQSGIIRNVLQDTSTSSVEKHSDCHFSTGFNSNNDDDDFWN